MSVYYVTNFLKCKDCGQEFASAHVRVRHELVINAYRDLEWFDEWGWFWKPIWKNPQTGLYESLVKMSFMDFVDYKNVMG